MLLIIMIIIIMTIIMIIILFCYDYYLIPADFYEKLKALESWPLHSLMPLHSKVGILIT